MLLRACCLGLRPLSAVSACWKRIYQTQFYQGVASGGREQTFKYGGKLDYEFTFLGEKLGLNEGFFAFMHAETRFGEDINAQAGALAFPNTAMLFPFPEQQFTSISGLYVIQALNEKVALTAGKYRTLDLFNMIYPDANVRGNDGFMNLSMMLLVTLFRTTALSLNGAGVLGMKGTQVQSGLLVYDTQNVSTTIAPDLFGEGAVVLGYHRFFTEVAGKPGSHGFLGNYSSRTYTSTNPLSWTIIPGEGLVGGQQTARGELEITDINNEYLRHGGLHVALLGRGFAWLDAGTPAALHQAASFVESVEARQGRKVACIEEVAYRMGFILAAQLQSLAEQYENSYGDYLANLT